MKRLFVPHIERPYTQIHGDAAHHLIHVLRIQKGKEIFLADETGTCAKAVVDSSIDGILTVKVLEEVLPKGEPPVQITLVQALPKGDKMDWIVQKSVELGVTAIQPVITQRIVVQYDQAKQTSRQQRWQKIATEAAQQCGRAMIPKVYPICSLKEFLRNNQAINCLMLYEEEHEQTLKHVLRDFSTGSYALLIGPEGGLAEAEVALAHEAGFKGVTIGPRILRTETAALAGLSAILYEHGDLGG